MGDKLKFLQTLDFYHGGHFIGSDPEIFVESNGDVIPAFNFLGSKQKPDKTASGSPYGGKRLYWDGFAAEFETHPIHCVAYQVDSIRCGLKAIQQKAQEFDKEAHLSNKTVFKFKPSLLKKAKPEQVELGCKPSFNIYGLKVKFEDPRKTYLRSCGGHIHFGIGKVDQERAVTIVETLDAILGVLCVSLFEGFDHNDRRKYYGLPGEFRLPPYGIEYRTLSNAWLIHPAVANLVLDLSRRCVALERNRNYSLGKIWDIDQKETVKTILNNDVENARKIMEHEKEKLLYIFKQIYGGVNIPNSAYKAFFGGINSFIKNPSDIVGNWRLNGVWQNHCAQPKTYFVSASSYIQNGQKI